MRNKLFFYGSAIVVIANDGLLLKAEENPYMMKDRPVVTYTPEKVAGRLVGMGTVQKGYNITVVQAVAHPHS